MHDNSWSPTHEQLAAYFDGEMEGRDDLVHLKRRLEAWLGDHPQGNAELADHRHLQRLWQASTPADPAPAAFERIFAHITHLPRLQHFQPTGAGRPWGWVLTLIGTAALVAGVWFTPPREPDVEVFQVATESEVTILSVEGADTGTLVVGLLPVQGPLELAAPGEVTLTNVRPDPTDNMMPQVRFDGASPPIIWARTESEEANP